jgi:FkbM family methyltransferase
MSISLFSRLFWLLERRSRAKHYGIAYARDKGWKMPRQVRISGNWVTLSYPSDQGSYIAFKDVFISDVYWLDKLREKRFESILDIGGHAGFFSLAAKNVFPNAKVHSYEPNSLLWPHIDSHAGQAGFSVFHEAVGSQSGWVSLQEGQDSVFTQCRVDDQGDVKMTSIAEAIERVSGAGMLDLLKMDCEGGEWEIFNDTASMKKVRCLSMEYHLFEDKPLTLLRNKILELGFVIKTEQSDGETNGRILAVAR